MKIDMVTIYGYNVILALSFLWGSFVAYKKALEAHFDEVQVMDVIVLAGFWSFVLGRLTYVLLNLQLFWNNWARIFFLKNYPGLSHWGLLLGIALALFLVVRKNKQKFFDWLDFAALGLAGGMAIYFAGLAINRNIFALGAAIVSLAVFSFLWKAEKEYRTYAWYKNKKTQAKSGFISGVVLSYYGLVQLAWQLASQDRKIAVVITSILLFVGGWFLVYSRSGRNLSDDIKLISRYGKK